MKKDIKNIPIIDTDIHQGVHDQKDLIARMDPAFREWGVLSLNRSMYSQPYGGGRRDAGGGSIEKLSEGLLDQHNIVYGVATGGMTRMGMMPNSDYAVAILQAYNEYVQDYWLNGEKRLLGSITVGLNDPHAAAAMIREFGQDERFVMVMVNSTTVFPLGNPYFHPVFEACNEMNLPLALHPGGEGTGQSHSPTANGYPRSYLEWHTNLSANYITQVCSVICEGVFEKYKNLKLIAVEGGISWLPHLMWRLDKNWKGLRYMAPWLKRLPSEYIMDHVLMTTQPIEEPTNPKHLNYILEMIEAERTLMFSSDFPHWDFDNPDFVFRTWEPELVENVFWRTALKSLRMPSYVHDTFAELTGEKLEVAHG